MDTKKTKEFIRQALENIPLDVRFEEVKSFLTNSLKKINEIEQKDLNKFNLREKWNQESKNIQNNYKPLNNKQKTNILNVIEELIDKEKKNIQEIGRNKIQKNILID